MAEETILIVETGYFSDEWAKMAKALKVEVRMVTCDWRHGVDIAAVKAALAEDTAHAIKAGPEGCRSLLISSPAGFAELITRVATPAHLAGPDTEIDLELFASVSAELGDQILGPPGAVPTTCDRLRQWAIS